MYISNLSNNEKNKKIILVDNYLNNNFNYEISRKIKNENKLSIIIEPRPHYRLKTVINNILFFLGEDWDLLFIGSEVSINYLNNILPDLDCHLEYLNIDNLNPVEYSKILMDKNLLEKYNYENIFVFQTDSILIKKFNNDILNYNYIGAPDYSNFNDNSYHLIYNGGISFRKRSFMLYCLNNINIDLINSFRKKKNDEINGNNIRFFSEDNLVEDFYYSNCLSIINHNEVIDLEINNYFGQLDKFLNIDKLITIHAFDKVINTEGREFITFDNLSKILKLSTYQKNLGKS